MEALGLLEMWQSQIDASKQQSAKAAEMALNQIMSGLNPSHEYRARFSSAFEGYLKKLEAPWTAKEIVDVWGSYYGPHFSDEELDRLLAFYTSDLGKKDVSITKRAMGEFTKHFQEAGTPILEKATKEFLEELKIVANECRCQKKI